MSRYRYLEPYKLSILQRAALIPYFGIGSVLQPSRGDLVAGFGDTSVVLSPFVLENLHKQMMNNPSGKKLLETKPLITEESLDFNILGRYRAETLGHHYHAFMMQHGFSANQRSHVRFMDNYELAYVMIRYRQIHDFWHVLSGLPPSLLGEIALKCFEYQVTGLPLCLIGGLVGQVRLNNAEMWHLYRHLIPWVVETGKSSGRLLMSYNYESNLEKDISQVRKELSFEPAPCLITK